MSFVAQGSPRSRRRGPCCRDRGLFEAARKEYERDLQLSKDNIVSESHLDQSRLAFEQAKAEYDALSSNTSKDGNVCVTSPIGGYIKVVALVAVIVAFVTLRLVIMSFVSVVMPLVTVPFMVVIVSVIMPLVSLHAMSVVMFFVIGMVAASCQNRAECHCQ